MLLLIGLLLWRQRDFNDNTIPSAPTDVNGQLLESCKYCSGYHPYVCPYIEEIEWDGPLIQRVKFRKQHFQLARTIQYVDGDELIASE